MTATEGLQELTGKQSLWLSLYLDRSKKDTFLNGVQCALLAYNTDDYNSARQIAVENKKKLANHISHWLESEGLSDTALKFKLIDLMSAKEIKFFSEKGYVVDEREVEALETQRKTLDMALKVKGLYAADKLEVHGFENLAERMARANREAENVDNDSIFD